MSEWRVIEPAYEEEDGKSYAVYTLLPLGEGQEGFTGHWHGKSWCLVRDVKG